MKLELTNTEYHARPEISKSGLDLIQRSPAHYRAAKAQPHEETPAMQFGTAAHTAILEPERFQAEYIAAPDSIDRRTKAGKEAWAELEASGKTVISVADWTALLAMRESVMSHPSARELFESGVAESSYFSTLEGVAVKCRPDWMQGGLIVDLKTTQDASPSAFSRSVAGFRYHVQHALYADILASLNLECVAFLFVAVEKSPPYAVGVYELDADSVTVGREAYQRNLDTYRKCLETDQWPAYSPAVETLTLPRWAMLQTA